MTKKVTITVSDELHQRMEKLRGELNFSRIFQNAVAAEIDKKELFHTKLKEEKSFMEIFEGGDIKTIQGQYAVGKELGFAYAKTAPYREIKRFEKYAEKWHEQEPEVVRQFYEELHFLSLLTRIGVVASADNYDEYPPDDNHTHYDLGESFDIGFLTGIVEFIREECTPNYVEVVAVRHGKSMYISKDEEGNRTIFVDPE